jgi:3',5'-cyclic AMP phosphodiesterase CpdA
MRTLAHISDLHFGREDPVLAEELLADLGRLAPSLVAVSGDLTQRAKPREFEAARAWLRRLPAPSVVVPGNHDVPLYNVWRRFTAPLALYQRYIDPEPYPMYVDAELAVLGVSTTRALSSGGQVGKDDLAAIEARLAQAPAGAFRVLITHHQYVPHPSRPRSAPMRRVEEALETIERCAVELLLAGHMHLGYYGDVRAHYATVRRSILFVQAGTAISHRRRGEPNAWNRIVIFDADHLEVEPRAWDGQRFAPGPTAVFERVDGAWKMAGAR